MRERSKIHPTTGSDGGLQDRRTARVGKMKHSLWIVLLFVAATLSKAQPGPIPRDKIPEALRPWVDWVLHDHEESLCPFLQNAGHERRCAWPSPLVLSLDDKTGRFTQDWLVFQKGWVPLPGDERRWPQDVKVDGKPVAALLHGGMPSLELEKGQHTASGAFQWDMLPALFPVPPETGLVSLSIAGAAVPFPNREPLGQLWLQKRREEAEESRIDLSVHRLVTDEVPLLLRTRIELRVSGKSREEVLGKSLPAGFVPMSLESPLPARVEPDGRLRVQVRPGRWTIDLLARQEGPAATLILSEVGESWDSEEEWVFDARPSLRLVTVEGVPAIDPQQTEIPSEWRRFPAYRMRPGSTMKLAEKRRGDADPEPDQLSLQRIWWLDFDGQGFTVHDLLSGTMHRGWRLEMAPGTMLGRVAVDGRDQFITRLGNEPAAGVEIRQSILHVEADSRVEDRAGRISAVGWQHDFQQVAAELRLPPGWRLFRASGVDDVSSSWLTDWTLLDLFIVLLIAMTVAKLAEWRWGAMALVTLALTYREPGAPGVVWLLVLAGLALLHALPEGGLLRLIRLYTLGTLVALLLVAVPFLVQQLRQGIWPALEPPMIGVSPQPVASLAAAKAPAVRAGRGKAERMLALGAAVEEKSREALSADQSQGSILAPVPRREVYRPEIDPNALISTGPGLPRWTWSSVSLHWRGPVQRNQTLSFALLSPRMNLLLAILRVGLLSTLVFWVVRSLAPSLRTVLAPSKSPLATTTVLLSLILLPAGSARADFPSKELLDELRSRLLENPQCFPACASIPRLRLEATVDAVTIRLEVAAAADTAVPLPGNARSWSPRSVALDGRPATGLLRTADEVLWLEVSAGNHQVLLEGPLPVADTVEIPLPLRPHRVEVAASGWTVTGLREDGLVEENLQLARIDRGAGKEGEVLRPGTLPPFVRIERTLRLGLSLEVDTLVSRMTQTGSALVLDVPLLVGESVTTPDLRVENGKARVSLAPQATQTAWHSILKIGDTIELSAPDSVPWVEVWRVEGSPIWHLETKGIPVIHSQSEAGPRRREWHPWPGEQVAIALSRPTGAPGQTLTIDRSFLEMSPGLRASDAKLLLELRSSRGGQHVITLPENAELLSVSINGTTQPIRQEKRSVTIPVTPGSQSVVLSWREAWGITARLTSPEVDAGAESVNADLQIHIPTDRWVLFLGGPRFGPAVLFWSVLAVLLLVSVGLARVRLAPLRAHQWFLLGIGFTQVDISIAAIVAGWLLALGWRGERGAALNDRIFDLMQILLAAWTLLAFGCLVVSIQQGLLGLPEMQISGNGSSAYDLHWMQDRAGALLPRAWVISIPLFCYRIAMLAWALWLSWAFVGWIRWGWICFRANGLWRGKRATARTSGVTT